ncbi:MAG TPA: DUF885 domain-containing protein [Steroidobacteraceae bacterium]|nr:DUF885 domain-containing protein [Steroidobacteraceae bacterium]
MQTRLQKALLPLLLLALPAVIPAPALADAAGDLHGLFDREYERDHREGPLNASYTGDNRYSRELPDDSPAFAGKSHQADLAVLRELEGIQRAALTPADQLNYDLFRHEYRDRVTLYPFRAFLYADDHRGGVHTLNEFTDFLPFQSVEDYEDWLARLGKYGGLVDQHIANWKLAVKEKRVLPRILCERMQPQIAQQDVADPEKSPYFDPFRKYPESFDAATRGRLSTQARATIRNSVLPAIHRLRTAFEKSYLPACRASVGIWDTPKGDEYYRALAKYYTTTDLTPDEIHEIGLKEVARIHGEMVKVIAEVGFKGTFDEFLNFLRTDPQFYYQTGDELFNAYLATAKRIDPNLTRLFGKLPRTPYGVRPIPMTSAPNTTTAYYNQPSDDGKRPGYYYVNLYKPEVRPKYEMEVLTVHEAVPGHHLQIALQLEMGDMPQFRKNASYTAYVEGWGLYSESLGYQLGLYTDPYSKFGQLTYEMWRAVRLVVDTGIHSRHWTRQQAIDYFKANAAKTETDIVNEIDRYIGTPGQALAYKIGQLRILGLREEAQAKLGARFDIREFHDTVLATGAVPLDVLERTVHDWIASKQ